ncbi:MAG: DNA topoisomerase, partial [Patescibacteria group bacterium]
MKDLVIVESPTKARTLSQYLGKSYNVLSSKGHVRDLPKSKLGVDVEKDFEPQFRLVHGKGKIVKELKENLKDADTVWLATDLDREGEAIAWHLKEVLELPDSAYERVTFHEITKTAIENAFESPGQLNINLVEAQKARRILDRLVGYKLSPLLWKKIQAGLSAGRVQSVAVRFVVEREREREEFSAENYWTIEALVASEEGEFGVDLRLIDGDNINLTEKKDLFSGTYQVSKTVIDSEEAAEEIRKELQDEEFTVVSVETKTVRRKPYPPFITSSLQTAAASLGFSSSQTMRVAQRLYEEGLITYHRTDSRFLSPEAVSACRSYVKGTLG